MTFIHVDSPLPRPFFAPFGSSAGDQLLPPGDDITEGPIFLDQSFKFFGKNENEAYVCMSIAYRVHYGVVNDYFVPTDWNKWSDLLPAKLY